jgi:DNA-binding transcriptional MerR regulator
MQRGNDIAAVLTTSALEKKTGVSRTTVYFYVRQGLLPEPQKTATGRSLYGEDHVTLLRKIGELKREGLACPTSDGRLKGPRPHERERARSSHARRRTDALGDSEHSRVRSS